jgi:hypothetical protein
VVFPTTLFAQDRKDKTPVTYEEIYDEPYSVNRFFIGFQPLYGELFVSNVNAGFGAEALYYHEDKFNVKATFRKTYSQQFFDFARNLASTSSDVDNRTRPFIYYELGGTYHVKDFEQASKTKMFLYKNSYKGNRWASRVPLHAKDIASKVRKIYGARFGAIHWNSTVDLTQAMAKQGLTNESLINEAEGTSLPLTQLNPNTSAEEPIEVFSNLNSTSFYLGGSMSWIRNVAVSFDKFEEGVDDLMLTVFADIMYAPIMSLDDVVYTPRDQQGNRQVDLTATYSVDAIKLQNFGFRLGIDGRFNRTLSWSYGGEIGYRPSLEGRSFFAMFKISFPVYGTNLDYSVESFGK